MTQGTYSAYDSEGHRKYLTLAEGKRFRRCASRLPQDQASFCLILYFTGMRISEALALTAMDVDFSMCVLRVRSLKKRAKKEFRRIPVPDSLISALQTIVESHAEGPLWTFSRSTAWRIVKRVMADAEISGIQATAKGLRHGFGVRGALAKVPLNLLQLWFGHSQATTTAIYLDVRDEEERELMQRTWK
ncbi:Phage integrase family protein [Prosthecobacter debontii]|uniref:Phage integrase family protein n=1 Tax=Prosthecobacter debontii TaxID=48467 RepID=A0A1T4YK27_9BACT|nr:site-specific integrase [Prosthecobacter debontii]SKB01898.1 Phage integrase family protein [Prosthecobacter debontii]